MKIIKKFKNSFSKIINNMKNKFNNFNSNLINLKIYKIPGQIKITKMKDKISNKKGFKICRVIILTWNNN